MTETSSARKPRVLFLCTGNTARSQMAQALLEKQAGDKFEVTSAGLEPGTLNPLTVKVLQEMDVPTDHLTVKPTTPLLQEHFTFVITVCDRAEQNCPIFPHAIYRESWPFEDPAAAEGSEEERMEVFRRVRDQIDEKVRAWVAAKA
ncbi:arsenate reductase ArsC [Deinococcus sp. VB343]|uniref:Arsenate reductase ArsC n=1 Tax=Deinococcus sp. VB142 TaxID=3112952 RepID=A0AAU6Q238_9DEIO